jgi:O-antigen ligase
MVFLRSNLKIKQTLLLSAGILILVASIGVFTPGIKDRFVELFRSFNVKPKDVSYDSTNIRRAIFDCSVAISKENFLFGIGFENLQNELNACYKENYDSSFYDNHNYMTHNYFFYILLSSGIFGLILFLFYLANIIRIAFKANLFLFYVFLFNVIIIWFIEDYLYRQYGILYFNLMLLCFIRWSQNISNDASLKSNNV